MSPSKNSQTKLTPPKLDLPPFPTRPNSPSQAAPISWSTPKPPPPQKSSVLSSISRSISRRRKNDKLYFKVLEVPFEKPSEAFSINAFTPKAAADFRINRDNGDLQYLVPSIPSAPKKDGDQFERMAKSEFRTEGDPRWQGKYTIWYSKDQDVFYVLKQGATTKLDEKTIVMHESVPSGYIGSAIIGWLTKIANELRKNKAC
ncbi:hypothetical protein ACLMJK_001900 [Lecanora helva]